MLCCHDFGGRGRHRSWLTLSPALSGQGISEARRRPADSGGCNARPKLPKREMAGWLAPSRSRSVFVRCSCTPAATRRTNTCACRNVQRAHARTGPFAMAVPVPVPMPIVHRPYYPLPSAARPVTVPLPGPPRPWQRRSAAPRLCCWCVAAIMKPGNATGADWR